MADNEKKTEQTVETGIASSESVEVKKTDIAKTEKKETSKKKKAKKPGFFSRVGKWFKELFVEAKKVVWPSGRSVAKNTLVVITIVIIVSAFVALVDFVFGGIRDLLATLLNTLL